MYTESVVQPTEANAHLNEPNLNDAVHALEAQRPRVGVLPGLPDHERHQLRSIMGSVSVEAAGAAWCREPVVDGGCRQGSYYIAESRSGECNVSPADQARQVLVCVCQALVLPQTWRDDDQVAASHLPPQRP